MLKLIFTFCITLCVYILPAYTQSYKYLKSICEAGSGDNQLGNPSGMVILKDTIYISDGFKIKKFDTLGYYLGQWVLFDEFGNNFYGGIMNTNPEGHILASNNFLIQEYTTQGALVRRIKMRDVFGFDNSLITSITVDKMSNIYAGDALKGRIYQLSKMGSILKKWQYDNDTTYDNDKSVRIYFDQSARIVLQYINKALIQKMDTNGKLLVSWIDTAARASGYALGFGANGTLFFPRANSIDLLDSNFRYISTIARTGINEGQFSRTDGIALDSKMNLYVANRQGNILVFAYSETPTGMESENRNISISSIYPNPFQDVLEVNVEGKGEATLELTDLTGCVVSSTHYYFNPVQLNTSQLQKGLYLCRIIQNGKQVFVKKVQK
jgi:hypothetical protein